MIRIILAFILSTSFFAICAQRERTTMNVSKSKGHHTTSKSSNTQITTQTITEDTLTFLNTDLNRVLHIAGYDKPLTASRETMHVKNLTVDTVVSGLQFAIIYLDSRGRELHRRNVWINSTIEPGETQLITFPTWDIQRSFYYRRSVKPRRQSTPYDVSIEIKAITVPTL